MHYVRNKVPYNTNYLHIIFHEANWYIEDYGRGKYLTITAANLEYKVSLIKFEKMFITWNILLRDK